MDVGQQAEIDRESLAMIVKMLSMTTSRVDTLRMHISDGMMAALTPSLKLDLTSILRQLDCPFSRRS